MTPLLRYASASLWHVRHSLEGFCWLRLKMFGGAVRRRARA